MNPLVRVIWKYRQTFINIKWAEKPNIVGYESANVFPVENYVTRIVWDRSEICFLNWKMTFSSHLFYQ